MILDTYTLASRSVFYFWIGCISICWLLMVFIKDKGLQRKGEEQEAQPKCDAEARLRDEEGGSMPTSGDEEDMTEVRKIMTRTTDVEKAPARDVRGVQGKS